MRRGLGPTLVLVLLGCVATAQPPKNVTPDGGRQTPVHRIPLYQAEGEKIALDDDPLLPFSPRVTCGQCHDYAKIRRGWHFNAADPTVPPGRPGEPWILYDGVTGTQLPLSYRRWKGTYRPEQAGVSPWVFTRAFGSHLPGGGVAEPADVTADPNARWLVSGKLEINCLHCHLADRRQDLDAWAKQVAKQNFRWAAAVSCGLATVDGTAAKAPDSYDPFMETNAETKGPTTTYDGGRFNAKGEVFFDVVRRPDASRCYACHSGRRVGPGAPEKWHVDRDVHLTAGMACTDCHRNALGHAIVRGYEGEAAATGNGEAATLTCRGCHLGVDGGPGGRLGAPVPKHAGLPPIHLEKLSCTACHSGPIPARDAFLTQTSASHRMGVHGGYRGEDSPPYVLSPVMLRQADGVIAPHKMMWPSFWGVLKGDAVTPLSHFKVRADAADLLAPPPAKKDADTAPKRPALTRDTVVAVLRKLASQDDLDGDPVFVSGGRLHGLGDAGLATTAHPAAEPYSWPLAHDVRPASRSLGAAGCTDCHATDAPFHFGVVTAATPGTIEVPVSRAAHEWQDLDPVYLEALGASFEVRTAFKWIGFAAAGVLFVVLLVYGLQGAGRLLGGAAIRDNGEVMFGTTALIALAVVAAVTLWHYVASPRRRVAEEGEPTLVRLGAWERMLHAVLGVSFVVLLATGAQATLTGRLTGFALLAHLASGGVFAVSLALAAVTWAEACRLRPHDLAWFRRRGWLRPEAAPAGRFDGLDKSLFWLGCVSGAVATVSVLLAMVPAFGPAGLLVLDEVHRFSSLVAVCVVLVYAYRTVIWKPGAGRMLTTGRVGAGWARHYHARWLEEEGQSDETGN